MTPATIDRRATLIVLAKRPVPGRVKTRLTSEFSAAEAAELAAASLADTLRTVGVTPARERVLAFDGDPTGWLPRGWRHVAQSVGTLDLRIAHAFAAVGNGPALLIGMDTPQLTRAHLERFEPGRHDAAIGRATDGGYWALGFRDARFAARALPGVPMSTSTTGQAQVRRLHELGLTVDELDVLDDVDTPTDADRVAALAPAGAFAAAVRDLRQGVSA